MWVVVALLCVPAPAAHANFVEFEGGHVRPLAMSPDGTKLFAVNTPDNRLEIFSIGAPGLTHTGSVPVGLEPVAVAVHTNSEVWVVNHLSDSVSIVDVGSTVPEVTRTLLVGDEPRDIVFAGTGGVDRAFITCAHRGQNSGVNPTDFITAGAGRADVWVFDANNLGAGLGGTPVTGTPIVLFGDTPRALAVSPDHSTVYAAVFHSGNQTTTLNEGAVCNTSQTSFTNNTVEGPCNVSGVTMPGGLPLPHTNANGDRRPEVGLIVKFDGSHWVDRACRAGSNYGHVCTQDSDCPSSVCGRIWDNGVWFNLPDKDVFALDANANPPVQTTYWTSVGTILFNMVTNPVTGKVYVTNADARNETRFEGPGIFGGSTVQGHLAEYRITVLDGSSVLPRHLNKHIDYSIRPAPAGVKDNSLATPLDMAITSDGSTMYVAAFGSSKIGVFNTSEIENNTFTPNSANHISVTGGGPSGVVLDETRHRLYVSTRFDNGISVINTDTRTEIDHPSLYNPEPASILNGRRFLYDAYFTSSNGEAACASCHIFGDFDSLAWDLGNPDDTVLHNPNPFRVGPFIDPDFHPMKGPMTTQSLRGMANHGPMHWRGDRTGGNDPGGDPLDSNAAFNKFNVAFAGLLGRTGPLSTSDMQAFTDFILQVKYPPNPIRAIDNSLTPDQQAGRDFFFNTKPSDTLQPCNGCHVLDPPNGHFGSDGFSSFEGEPQILKIPHLRNLYQKVGMFGMPAVQFLDPGDNGFTNDQVRGFGFLHDGSVDTVFRFHHAIVFNQGPLNVGFANGAAGDVQRRQVEQFMLAFDSNLAPIVGQQITLTPTNAATVAPRINQLLARAAVGDCDLVAKGTLNGEQRGWYRTAVGGFQSDRADETPVSDSTLRAQAATTGQDLTYTCAPAGSGVRVGVDRDGDGAFDRDELDAGSDPADAASLPAFCNGPSLITRPRILVVKNLDPPGDERLTLSGGWRVQSLTPPIDPLANGFRFQIEDKNGAVLFSRIIPGGAAGGFGPGWTVNRTGTQWRFRDPTGTVAGGIRQVLITNRSTALTPGYFTFQVTGVNGNFQIAPTSAPVRLKVVLGGVAQGQGQQCATLAFSATSGAPKCTVLSKGSVITCH